MPAEPSSHGPSLNRAQASSTAPAAAAAGTTVAAASTTATVAAPSASTAAPTQGFTASASPVARARRGRMPTRDRRSLSASSSDRRCKSAGGRRNADPKSMRHTSSWNYAKRKGLIVRAKDGATNDDTAARPRITPPTPAT